MSDNTVFFDTNILLYIFMEQSEKSVTAEKLLSQKGTVSVQVLNELCHVVRRKMKLNFVEMNEILAAVKLLCQVEPLDLTTHELGIDLTKHYNFSTYDAMIVASAIRSKCSILYSEDMQSNLVVNDTLRIINPFA